MTIFRKHYSDPKRGKAAKTSQPTDRPSTSAAGGGSQSQQISGEPSVRQRLQQTTLSGSQSTDIGQQPQTHPCQQPHEPKKQTTGKQLGAKPKELHRTQPIQTVRLDDSQGAWGEAQPSTSSGGIEKQQKQAPIVVESQKSIEDANKLKVAYKGAGTKGRSLGPLETNYLKLIIDKMTEYAYHYDVKIEPDRPKKLLMMVFLQFVEINFPNASIAFDDANSAYASEKLMIGDIQRKIQIIHPETGAARTFIVSIQEANNSQIPIKNALTR